MGDAEFQKKCLGKMEDVADEGRTVLFVSHNMAAIEQLTKRSLVLKSGSLVMNASTKKAVPFYLNDFIKNKSNVYYAKNSKRMGRQERKLKFVHVKFENSLSNIFSNNDDISIIATIKAVESVKNFRINLTVFQSKGVPVGSSFGPQTLEISNGDVKRYRIKFNKLSLAPGKYYFGLSVGLGSYLDRLVDFDIIHKVLYFQIKLSNSDDDVLLNWNPSWGIIKFDQPKITEIG